MGTLIDRMIEWTEDWLDRFDEFLQILADWL